MNWYIKQIFAQSEGLQKYLENLGVSSNIIQYINSLDKKTGQILVNEVRKNPSLTLEQLQSFQTPQQINPYSNYEINTAKNYPEPMKTWILVNLRKLRVQKELSTENKRAEIHNTYMYLIDNLPQILDWVQLSQPPIDISSYTPERAINASDEWHRTMSAQGEGEVYEKTNPELIVYGPDWKNPQWKSWTIQKVIGKNDLEVEGNRMDHCVGGFCKGVERGDSVIYSLRDPYNEPHVTIEIEGDNSYDPGTIKQIQGKSNSEPKDEYKAMIKEWISNSGEESKIIKEINTFEELENENYYQNDGVEQLTDAIEKILQGESNEYGLKYVFDSDIESIIIKLVEAGEAENNNRDSNYYGNITNSPPYITNLALMQDLKLSHWPRHAGEWEELQKMPKQSEWGNIQEIEKWAFKTIDEIQEDFIMYDTGLEYPQEEEYEDPTEYEEAMEQYSENEAEAYEEWTKQSVKGGFALDLLNELKSFRESGLIPSPTELYEMQKKREKEIKNQLEVVSSKKNWYKKAQQQFQVGDIVELIGYKTESPGTIFKDNENGTFGVNTQTNRPINSISSNQLKLITPSRQNIIPQKPIQNIFFQLGQKVNLHSFPLQSPGTVIKDNGDGTYMINDKFGKSLGKIPGNQLQKI